MASAGFLSPVVHFMIKKTMCGDAILHVLGNNSGYIRHQLTKCAKIKDSGVLH